MRWGRAARTSAVRGGNTISYARAARAVIVTGSIVCALFFAAAAETPAPAETVDVVETDTSAVAAFVRSHASLATLLGVDAYFPEEAIAVGITVGGSPAPETAEPWTFSQYLRDALRRVLFGEEQA